MSDKNWIMAKNKKRFCYIPKVATRRVRILGTHTKSSEPVKLSVWSLENIPSELVGSRSLDHKVDCRLDSHLWPRNGGAISNIRDNMFVHFH
jgi:hypothetical protein